MFKVYPEKERRQTGQKDTENSLRGPGGITHTDAKDKGGTEERPQGQAREERRQIDQGRESLPNPATAAKDDEFEGVQHIGLFLTLDTKANLITSRDTRVVSTEAKQSGDRRQDDSQRYGVDVPFPSCRAQTVSGLYEYLQKVNAKVRQQALTVISEIPQLSSQSDSDPTDDETEAKEAATTRKI
ncbi:hypothetical protein MMC22_002778 [Lobaria immixta]|nr:hypothetical protein [Lobaria immixta]